MRVTSMLVLIFSVIFLPATFLWASVSAKPSLIRRPVVKQVNREQPQTSKPDPYKRENYEEVSIIQLIANPEKFDGKPVEFTGFVHIEFEGNTVYLGPEDCKHRILKNGVSLGVTHRSIANGVRLSKKYDGMYCSIYGIFHANPVATPGHYRIGLLWSGMIETDLIEPDDNH